MSQSEISSKQKKALSVPSYLKLQRASLAACIVLAPLVLFLGFFFDPTGGVPPAASGIFADFRAASPLRIQLFIFFNAITPYFFPLSYIGLGMLAMKRSPWLATIGIAFGLLGSLPFGFFVVPEAIGDILSKTDQRAIFIIVWNGFSSEGAIIFLQYSWVVGHILGYILLGIALGCARAIPLWAAGLIVVAIPFQAAAYMSGQGIYQLISYALIFIGSIPAALTMLRRVRNDEVLQAEIHA